MFIQQDWLMRQIEMMISMIIRLFNTKLSQGLAPAEEMDQNVSGELEDELNFLLRQGQLGKAEDLLFQRLDPDDKSVLITALHFYQQANALTDPELEAQDFTREELLEGLEQAVKRYGLCLPDFFHNSLDP